MGLDVGRITMMTPPDGSDFEHNIFVQFELIDPNYGYIWSEGSKAKVAVANLVGGRYLEVSRGTGGYPAYEFRPFKIVETGFIQSMLPEWEKWQLGQDVYDASGTNLVLHALSPLATNLPVLNSLGLKQVPVLDGRAGQKKTYMTAVWNYREGTYEAFLKGSKKMYELPVEESPAVTERL